MFRQRTDLASAAPLTVLALTANIVLYILCAVRSENFGNIDRDVLWEMGGSMREGLWEGEWLRLFAPNFLHGGLMHILFNTMSLYYLGPSAEVHFGSSNYGTLYLLSGIAGFCFSQIFGGNLSIGASCSLFGILGAQLVVHVLACPVLKNAWRNSEVRANFYVAVFYLVIGWLGLLGPVDNWGHFGGLLFGFLIGGLFEVWRRRGRLSIAGVAGVLVLCAALVVAARWSIFNPYYHLHQSIVAREEQRPAEADRHLNEARAWAKTWRRERKLETLIESYDAKEWSLADARQYGYRLITWSMRR